MFTPSHRLLYSLIFGWGMTICFVILPYFELAPTGDSLEFGFWFTGFVLAIRYLSMGPVFTVGATTFISAGVFSVLHDIFNPSNDGSAARGGFIGAIIMTVLTLIFYLVKSYWYLLRESYVFMKKRKYIIATITKKEIPQV